MKIVQESDADENFIEIQLSLEELQNLIKFYPIEGSTQSEEEFSKPTNIFIRRK